MAGSRLRVTAALGATLCLAASVPALASPGQHLQHLQQRQQRVGDQLRHLQQRQGSLEQRVQALDARRRAAEQAVAAIDARLHRLDGSISRLQGRLAQVQEHLATVHQELEQVRDRLERRKTVFIHRARAIYEAGPSSMVDALLSSQNFGDLVDRYAYYSSALDHDQSLVESISSLRDQVAAHQAEVATQERRLAEAKLRLESVRADVARQRARRAAVLHRRAQAVRAKRALLAEVRHSVADRRRVAEELDSEIARVRDIIRAAQAGYSTGDVVAPKGGGQLSWPAAGPMTSPFGMRMDPVTHHYQLHAGIDIGAPYGAPVFAADDGRVIYAGTMSGYGNVVVIDHGGGLSTLYGHLSAYSVADGQDVGRGERIANVGCTGWCTGPHLHFEVRVNGEPVDPVPYLR